ncbi:gliding motility-associated C-terminal domain-containing protein [Chitinophaga nivalis]|uniref:Gliding motility-associated C-terminal domain-containing protein n=1 Tax=Chitinophaga nivalis TaxID=2991709 RepID=A0ABT3IGK8_9BACT|nr:gliding motility-associated C-terminal domain-containing protein [Chitinophaga nivalis]MCW3467205.1 gliding motility-associated C-terminal domain-containing protein [Chitinophaga nivalis]MCW3483103.1 gliding motility-associated C-terminal domain-containing protein [Chitinophaga nivalis]
MLTMKRYIPLYLFCHFIMLSFLNPAQAQLTVKLTTNGGGITNCESRTLTTTVTGGSGNFQYNYGIIGAGSIRSENKPFIIIDPQPIIATTYSVIVYDNATGALGRSTVTVPPLASGDLNLFIPNVITPNGDGKNDTWEIRNANKDPYSAQVPIGAYKYKVLITNSNGATYLDNENTVGVNGWGNAFLNTGLISGITYWNGYRYNGTEVVPPDTYFYIITFYSCTYPGGKEFKGWIQVIY